MGIDVGRLTAVEQTALLTVYARALDARDIRPILDDAGADAMVRAIDYDFAGLGVPAPVVCQSSLRAKMLDDRVRQFVAAHPDAVVIDVGAGLDDGYRRVKPPASVDWYSVDLPGLIAVRDQALPPCLQEYSVAASVTQEDWAAKIPKNRPVFVVADGLFPFLSEAQVIGFFRQITELFPAGELAFNDYGKQSKFAIWLGTLPKAKMFQLVADQRGGFLGFNDPRTPEQWNPRLTFVEDARLAHAPEVELFPTWLRVSTRIAGKVEATSRSARVLRYRF